MVARKTIDPRTVPIAVEELRFELEHALGNVEALDRKIALLLAFLGGVGLFTAAARPEDAPPLSLLELALLLTLLVSALVAVTLCLVGLRIRTVALGAKASKMAAGTGHARALFEQAVANSLAASIDGVTTASEGKARSINLAFAATGIAILALVGFQIADRIYGY